MAFGMGKRLKAIARKIYLSIFPRAVFLETEHKEVLANMYPKLSLHQIRFYEGLPWFVDKAFANAITLPGFYRFNKVHIHLSKYQPDTPSGFSTIAHECFHALQYQEVHRDKGIGFMRIFLVHYLAEFFSRFFRHLRSTGLELSRALAYEQHSMEVPAIQQDFKIQSFLEKFGANALEDGIPDYMVVVNSGHQYVGSKIAYFLSGILLIIFTVTIVIVDVLLLVSAGLVFTVGSFFAALRL